jgi:hypothetical protein
MSILGTKKFSKTASGTNSAKVAQGTPLSGNRFLITDIAGSSDLSTSVLKLVEDSEGTPITLWEVIIGDGSYSHSFITPIQVTKDKSISVEVDGTSDCSANIAGEETSH